MERRTIEILAGLVPQSDEGPGIWWVTVTRPGGPVWLQASGEWPRASERALLWKAIRTGLEMVDLEWEDVVIVVDGRVVGLAREILQRLYEGKRRAPQVAAMEGTEPVPTYCL
jgi:hypothetical protein